MGISRGDTKSQKIQRNKKDTHANTQLGHEKDPEEDTRDERHRRIGHRGKPWRGSVKHLEWKNISNLQTTNTPFLSSEWKTTERTGIN